MEQRIERDVEICKRCEEFIIFKGEHGVECSCKVENAERVAFCQCYLFQAKWFKVPKSCPFYAEHKMSIWNKENGK
jgi:hypothetical protein